MIIVKQELEPLQLTDVEEDDESQSNCDINYEDYSCDYAPQVNKKVRQRVETFVTIPSLVYDRPKVFECYLCHKWWPTVGKHNCKTTLRERKS